MKINLKDCHYVLFVLLLAISLVFIVLDYLYIFGSIKEFKSLYYSIAVEKGLTSSYQYCLEFWTVLLFVILVFNRKDPSYLFWSLTFVYILIDDMYQLHEKGGDYVEANFDLHRFAYGPFSPGPIGEVSHGSI